MESREMLDDLVEALRWDPRVDASKIIVGLSGRVAVLRGSVRTYSERCFAEDIAKHVRGVSAIRNEIEVRLTIGDHRTDETLHRIAREVLDALALMPQQPLELEVLEGRVTIRGTVRWPFQRRLAERAVRQIAGVRGIDDRMTVDRSGVRGPEGRFDLTAALRRQMRDCSIQVASRGSQISLSGVVHTCAEREDAIDLAWCAPGITAVEDRLIVRP